MKRSEAVASCLPPLAGIFSSIVATFGQEPVATAVPERMAAAPILWNFPGVHSLEFQVAERVEFYSDTSLSERPKFALRYQPFDSSLTLRASYTEAFHAPNLSDLAPSAAERSGHYADRAPPSNSGCSDSTGVL